MLKRLAIIAVGLPLLAGQAGRDLLTVSAVRHWSLADVTRVAVEVSGDFTYRSDRLHNPERVYFDIPGAHPRINSRALYSETPGEGLARCIRVAETQPGVTRVVLEIGENTEVSPSQLANPYRLIVELRARAGGPAPPATAAGPPVPRPEAPRLDPPAVVKTAGPRPLEQVTAEPSKMQLAKVETARPEVRTEVPRTGPAKSEAGPKAAAGNAEPPAPASPAETGKPAKRTSRGENSLIRALGLKLGRVALDPGHGGHDQGTEGSKGLLEKDLVLDISKRLGALIDERMGAEVIYTREDDTFVPLEGRTALANEKKADLFLSIHANSSPVPRVAGVETWFLNITGNKDALDIAARENATSSKSVFERDELIGRILKRDKAEESREFANRIQTALYAFSVRNVPAAKNRGVRSAPFLVLIGATMPSVLVEIGFLSNSREEILLQKPDYRQKLAEALYRGLERYAEGLSHFQMALTPAKPVSGRTPTAQQAGPER